MLNNDLLWNEIPKSDPNWKPVPCIARLARKINTDLTIIDIESTTFVQNRTFGVTEIGMVQINRDGTILHATGLIDPQFPIDPEATALNGIDAATVAGQPYFERWLPLITGTLETTGVIGWNCDVFDIPGLRKDAARYGHNLRRPAICIDLRKRYLNFVRYTGIGRHGRLDVVAELFGLAPNPHAKHRALRDALLTMELLEEMLVEYGVAGMVGHAMHLLPVAKPNPNPCSRYTVEEDLVLDLIKKHGYHEPTISRELGMTAQHISEIAWDLHELDKLSLDEIANSEAQTWLRSRIDPLLTIVTGAGALRIEERIMRAAEAAEAPATVDLTQIRIALQTCAQPSLTVQAA